MSTTTMAVPTETLERIVNGGLRSLSDEELEVWWRFVEFPESDGDVEWPIGSFGFFAHGATSQERSLRRGGKHGNVLVGMAVLLARDLLGIAQPVYYEG